MTRIADDFASIAARLRELEGRKAEPKGLPSIPPPPGPVPWNPLKKLGEEPDDDLTFYGYKKHYGGGLSLAYARWVEEVEARRRKEQRCQKPST